MQELIQEVKGTRTYITYTDTSAIDKKVRIIYNTFCNEILKKQFVSNKEFMARYFPENGLQKSPISLKKDNALFHVVFIEKSFDKKFPTILNELIPYILKLQQDINQLRKDLK